MGLANDFEEVRWHVERGADIDALQENGVPAVVRLIERRKWDTVLYLIEKGANLDIVNANGMSVDYYLKIWEFGANDSDPEGWNRVREAIAARRSQSSTGTD